MRGFKFALVVAAVVSSSSGMAYAQIRLAKKGLFTAEDAYSQMGGISFQLASLDSGASKKLAQLDRSH